MRFPGVRPGRRHSTKNSLPSLPMREHLSPGSCNAPHKTRTMPAADTKSPDSEPKFVQGLGLLDSTMIVAGSMIGSGIFIVSADIARQVGSAGWLLVVWLITGVLTMIA